MSLVLSLSCLYFCLWHIISFPLFTCWERRAVENLLECEFSVGLCRVEILSFFVSIAEGIFVWMTVCRNGNVVNIVITQVIIFFTFVVRGEKKFVCLGHCWQVKFQYVFSNETGHVGIDKDILISTVVSLWHATNLAMTVVIFVSLLVSWGKKSCVWKFVWKVNFSVFLLKCKVSIVVNAFFMWRHIPISIWRMVITMNSNLVRRLD